MNCIRHLLIVLALTASGAAVAGPVNVNTADAETISAELNGVGLARANAIVAYRTEHGPFRSVEELLNVKGIGEHTLEMNLENIRLESSDAPSD